MRFRETRFYELDQLKSNFEKGIVSKKAYEYNVKYFNDYMVYKSDSETQKLIKEFELDRYIGKV